jgi:hypothetical protein
MARRRGLLRRIRLARGDRVRRHGHRGHADLASAVAAVRAAKYRGTVTIGASLAADPALKRLRHKPRTGRTGTAVST